MEVLPHRQLCAECDPASARSFHLNAGPAAGALARLKPPPAGQIDVWLAAPRAMTAREEESCLAVLSEDELQRWRRFVVPEPRLQYLVAHALLRRTLSRYLDIRPDAWRFEANAYGRPHIHGLDCGLRFNLSHTDGLVALAVAEGGDIGIDVEDMRRAIDLERLAPSVFSDAEVRAFANASAHDKREVFFSLWTLKEAYIKARGMGLSLGLDGFAFDLAAPDPAVRFDDRCPDDPTRWRFWRFRPIPSHALAVAAPTQMTDVRIMWTEVVTT